MLRWAALLALATWGQEKDRADADPSSFAPPPEFTLRARVAASTPSVPVRLRWRHGGEGLGGNVTSGTLAENLAPGAWSDPVPVASFARRFPRRLFVTFTLEPAAGDRKDRPALKNVRVEFEFQYRGKTVRTFEEAGPDGPTVGICIPAFRAAGGKTPDAPDFAAELGGLSSYARARAERIEALPGPPGPLPERYMIVTDLGGYGAGAGYGIRHTNPAVVETELRTLRRLGVNALRARPAWMETRIAERTGPGAAFARGWIDAVHGFPVLRPRRDAAATPGAGCPFNPAVSRLQEAQIAQALEHLKDPVDEVWLLTVDEIGSVFDQTPEGKAKHAPACADCTRAFQDFVRTQGLRPADFGKTDWSEVRPVDPTVPGAPLRDPSFALAAYQTARFGAYATARLFTPLREALARANAKKKADPSLRQPWLFSYALRGNTFLMRGHSLDFFDFYRHADNAFVYETSNRDPRVWGWDSYLCDVARVVTADLGLRFGIYVKPHRGAPLQRALAAASRGARMIYWYTYGPDYFKGDSFSERPDALEQVCRAARLLGAAEETLYGSSWARPAEAGIVNPGASERWLGLSGAAPAKAAAWENAKWIYAALQHAHVPVDPLDETLLAGADLSRYKVLYINGPHLTRAAAEKVAQWVRDGGTLYTSGGGLAYDEAHRPLRALEPVLGLKDRQEPRIFYRVALYGATRLEPYDDPRNVLAPVPPGARVVPSGPFAGSFPILIGREELRPSTAEVVARFEDGSPAVTRNAFGRGEAYVAAFFPGLEYSAPLRAAGFDLSRDLSAERRSWIAAPALARVAPVVDASAPAVEGLLLRNAANGRLAVTLANWAYRALPAGGAEPAAATDLTIRIRGAGSIARVRSLALDRALPADTSGETTTVRLPHLAEGDILLLESGNP
ncbi:MAG TPA: hypothetical protein VNO22_13290 [Planctomycetota bacterium]|nr:hypothetical protein [Planctomycetota bacterium]